MPELKRCSRCFLPETHETITFDTEGVCNICRQHEFKANIDWQAKKAELDEIIAKYKGKGQYDCIIPFSGGKDSTWTVYYLIKEYGLKPLVLRFNHGFLRPKVLAYTIRTLRILGADLLEFTPNWKIVQKLMLLSFLEKGDSCWHCHTGIFAYPMQLAIKLAIPLVIWGEPSSEYTAYYNYGEDEGVNEQRFNRFVNLGITADDMRIRLNGLVDRRDMAPFTYPAESELRKLGCRSICLGSYVPWDVKQHYEEIKRDLGWKGDEVENVPPGYEYEKIECYMQGVRDFIKYIKRGYSRPSHLYALDIRNGRQPSFNPRDYEGKLPQSINLFRSYIGLISYEFYEIAKSHIISPWQWDESQLHDWVSKTEDFHEWPRYESMPRSITDQILERWRKRAGKTINRQTSDCQRCIGDNQTV